ncbi:MAG TPA: hypothetical protein VM012_06935, partial [Flavitalea sp.]|nr:hypothetical protein [Flavitalea sp.]
MKTLKKKYTVALLSGWMILFNLEGFANIYTVINTLDNGAGSFRQAILDANGNAGTDTIRFLIPSGGGNRFEGSGGNIYAVIEIDNALPTITSPLFIDGSSQTNTNTGSVSGRTVGVDAIVQSAIP